MEAHLPIPAAAHGKGRAENPFRVVDVVFTSGRARSSVLSTAFSYEGSANVPDDGADKRAKKVILRNLLEAKFDRITRPLAERLLDPSQLGLLSSKAFFDQVLFHELSHGSLGPALAAPVAGEPTYWAIEECKADAMGAYNVLFLVSRGELPAELHDRLLVSYFAGLLRSARLGAADPHGAGANVQIGRFLEDGAARFDAVTKKFTLELSKLETSIGRLVHDLCLLEWTSDEPGAKALLAKYGEPNETMTAAFRQLDGVPVDLRPVYPLAGEKAP
jgi:hypothetical protein